jgi:hypothetical protein
VHRASTATFSTNKTTCPFAAHIFLEHAPSTSGVQCHTIKTRSKTSSWSSFSMLNCGRHGSKGNYKLPYHWLRDIR